MNQKKSSFDRGATNKRVNTHIVDRLSILNYLASLISLGHKVRKYWTKNLLFLKI